MSENHYTPLKIQQNKSFLKILMHRRYKKTTPYFDNDLFYLDEAGDFRNYFDVFEMEESLPGDRNYEENSFSELASLIENPYIYSPLYVNNMFVQYDKIDKQGFLLYVE